VTIVNRQSKIKMRFIIHEQPYEKLLASGQLRYEMDGQPTGAVESWRLTLAVEGYCFLRVDLDARKAASGHSYLYHLVMNEERRPERLTYRFWANGRQITGHILLAEESITATRTVNGTRFEEEVIPPQGYAFWFPTTIGLGLLANRASNEGGLTAVTLQSVVAQQPTGFELLLTQVVLLWAATEEVVVTGQTIATRLLTIRWADQARTIWLDQYQWPVKMARGDGLTAIETRYIRRKL
jgi:hypothetical protein